MAKIDVEYPFEVKEEANNHVFIRRDGNILAILSLPESASLCFALSRFCVERLSKIGKEIAEWKKNDGRIT